ncbi:FMN-binding protein [Cohnella lubricantis]|uniref:FMN-binding protein n=1 Tax=Cohnella lubricantis TaxID=2163172 RepID=A0A841TG43_9BACL|nr:FMN-binding protein [Cohnella lubricantis]MBB6678200.1 FMN-binding protein [Cohnella lubricantis]MBP2119673.1 major membrane immunogen (membrane-anchored lipoprotein) [Cohnella lubricantis]
MQRWMGFAVSLVVIMGGLTACGGNNKDNAASSVPAQSAQASASSSASASAEPAAPAEQQGYQDGVYYAEAADFDADSGWKEVVSLKVDGGKIAAVDWNALNKDGGLDKKTYSEKGFYGMKAGGASAEWHEQAAKAEQFLLDSQDPKAISVKDDGTTDAISGVSIHVGGFQGLVEKALAAGPVQAGPYKDGVYYAEAAEFEADSGWKDNVTLTVMAGRIAAVSWNSTSKDGGADKVTRSKSGEYDIKKGGGQAAWHEEAAKAQAYLIEKQDPAAVAVKDDGTTDAISGCTIHVSGFVSLAEQALASAR